MRTLPVRLSNVQRTVRLIKLNKSESALLVRTKCYTIHRLFGPTLLVRGVCYSSMKDADPPRYEARRATSWLVLFMTHVASCGAGAVIKNSQESGQSFIDDTDPEFRQKMAKRLGTNRHQSDVDIQHADSSQQSHAR